MSLLAQHGLMMQQGSAPVPGSYLDSLSVLPRAVLSLRKLISTATNAIRVRRSSDDAESDIGFSGDALDTAALASFVGGGSAYVVTVYDQTGNGENLITDSASQQPRIVNAGVYDGKLVFNGTSHSMHVSALSLGGAQVGLYWSFALPGTYPTANMAFELSPEFISNGPGTFASYRENSTWSVQSNCGATSPHVWSNRYTAAGFAAMSQTTHLLDTTKSGSFAVQVFRDGALLSRTNGASSLQQSGNYASGADLWVGARAGATLFCTLWLHTLVIYNVDSAGIRADIESIVAGA